MKRVIAALALLMLCMPAARGAEPKSPPVWIQLRDRTAQVSPSRTGTARSGGGNIDVQQPAPDTVVITLTAAVSAADHPCGSSAAMNVILEQVFEVVREQPDVKGTKLTLEARVIGALRSGRKGTASESGASATIAGPNSANISLPEHAAAGGESIAVNDKTGPVEVPAATGPYTLHVNWCLSAGHPKSLLGKSASAEFAPDPALDPLWIGGLRDPFHGAAKKDFGFQIILHVGADAPPAPKTEKLTRIAAGR